MRVATIGAPGDVAGRTLGAAVPQTHTAELAAVADGRDLGPRAPVSEAASSGAAVP